MDALSYLVDFSGEGMENAMNTMANNMATTMNSAMNTTINSTTASLTREQILTVTDLRRETIAIPEWGGDIIVRGMTAYERDKILSAIDPSKNTMTDSQLKATLCFQCIITSLGQRVFTEADIDILQTKNPLVLDRVANRILGLSGVGEAAVASIEKN